MKIINFIILLIIIDILLITQSVFGQLEMNRDRVFPVPDKWDSLSPVNKTIKVAKNSAEEFRLSQFSDIILFDTTLAH